MQRDDAFGYSQVTVAHEKEQLDTLRNIMRNDYAGICGITKEELLTDMSEDIDMLAKEQVMFEK